MKEIDHKSIDFVRLKEQYVQAGKGTAGIDLFIGEVNLIHRGLGSLILRKSLSKVVFTNDITDSCLVGPEPKNRNAIKAHEKAGFRLLKMIRDSG